MTNFDYREVLVSGNNYECSRDTNGKVHLFYDENGIKHVYSFDDKMHEVLSKASYFVTPEQIILEVVSIDFVNYKTGYTCFTVRAKFGKAI